MGRKGEEKDNFIKKLEALSAPLEILVHRRSNFTLKIGHYKCLKLSIEMLNKTVLSDQPFSKFTPPSNKYSVTPMTSNKSQ